MENLLELRLELWKAIAVSDPYGILQKLLFHELPLNQNQSPEGLLRLLGWVHVYIASGIHLYAFFDFWSKIAEKQIFHRHPSPERLRATQTLLWSSAAVVVGILWFLQRFRFGFFRPIFMILLRRLARRFGLKWSGLAPLGITYLVDCTLAFLFDFSTLGQLHYYLAVGGGFLAVETWKPKGVFKTHVILAFGSWIGIALYDLVIDHRVLIWTPLWTLVTLPIFCTLFYPAFLIGMFAQVLLPASTFPVPPLSFLAEKFNQGIDILICILDRLNLSYWVVDSGGVLLGGILASITTVIFLIRPKRGITAAMGISLILIGVRFALGPQAIHRGITVEVRQWDVGQGDALSIQKRSASDRQTEWIDVGSMRSRSVDRWILDWSRHGITSIDGIRLSHLDEDHMGSLLLWAAIIPVGCIDTHRDLWQTPEGKSLRSHWKKLQPQTIVFQAAKSETCLRLSSVRWIGGGKHGKGNRLVAGSVVPIDSKTVLLTAGDADQGQEDQWVQQSGSDWEKFPQKIWHVNHHGSKFSTRSEMMKKINPDWAWVSVGSRNFYGHPHPRAILALGRVPLFRTDRHGDLVFKSNAAQPEASKIRRWFFLK